MSPRPFWSAAELCLCWFSAWFFHQSQRERYWSTQPSQWICLFLLSSVLPHRIWMLLLSWGLDVQSPQCDFHLPCQGGRSAHLVIQPCRDEIPNFWFLTWSSVTPPQVCVCGGEGLGSAEVLGSLLSFLNLSRSSCLFYLMPWVFMYLVGRIEKSVSASSFQK